MMNAAQKQFRPRAVSACALAVMTSLVATLGRADTATLDPVADAFVIAAKPANNFGAGGALIVAAPTLPKGEAQSLLRFDFAPAKAIFDATLGAGNWKLSDATLNLVANNGPSALFNTPAAGTIRVLTLLNDAWLEGAGTPNIPTADGVSFGDLATLLSADDESLGDFPVTTVAPNTYGLALAASAAVEAKVKAGGLLSLRIAAADDHVAIQFGARTIANAALRPTLVVHVAPIPEPSTILMLAFGGAAMSVARTVARARHGSRPARD